MEKKLLKIGEITKKLKLTHRTIRYYDQLGLLPHIKRSQKGTRLFDKTDIEVLKKIKSIQKKTPSSLEKIKLKLFNQSNQNKNNRIVLIDIHSGLTKIKQTNLPIELFPQNINKADSKDIEKFILKITNNHINEIYWIFSSLHTPNHKQIFKKISEMKKLNHLKITPINTKSLYGSPGLLGEIIAEELSLNKSQETIDILINKQVPLIYQIGLVDDFTKLNKHPSSTQTSLNTLYGKLLSLKCSFSINEQDETYHLHQPQFKKNSAYTQLIDIFNQEIERRDKYCNRILISHNIQNKDAVLITKKIKEICPTASIMVQEAPLIQINDLGEKSILITMI